VGFSYCNFSSKPYTTETEFYIPYISMKKRVLTVAVLAIGIMSITTAEYTSELQ